MTAQKLSPGSRRSPEASRAAILAAATLEFAAEGLAGARTDAIAKAAGVNKALLYYYFHDKEGLYGAVLQHVLGDLLQRITQILDSDRTASYRVLSYAATHFNFVALHPEYRRLMQFEMMRAGAGNSPHFAKLIDVFFRPLMTKVISVLQEGIRSGEFRPVHPQHFLQSMISVIVFYFVALPSLRVMMPIDPLSPAALRQRRDAVLDVISGSLFQDRESAPRIIAEVNQEVESVTPVPEKRKRGKKQ
jgi:TetR/AcrR family transcriptional regulator